MIIGAAGHIDHGKTALIKAVRSVCQDRQGDLWAALQNGKLLHGRGSEWAAVHAGNGWLGGEATSVAGGQRGVWVGTRDRGLQQWRPDAMPQWTQVVELGNEWVRALLETSNGDLLIATGSPNRLWLWRGGKLRALALPGEVRVIRALAEAGDGTVWVGTSDGQLLRIAGDHVIREPVPLGESAPLIRTLHATADGSLWIGYAGAGVGRLWKDRQSLNGRVSAPTIW